MACKITKEMKNWLKQAYITNQPTVRSGQWVTFSGDKKGIVAIRLKKKNGSFGEEVNTPQ